MARSPTHSLARSLARTKSLRPALAIEFELRRAPPGRLLIPRRLRRPPRRAAAAPHRVVPGTPATARPKLPSFPPSIAAQIVSWVFNSPDSPRPSPSRLSELPRAVSNTHESHRAPEHRRLLANLSHSFYSILPNFASAPQNRQLPLLLPLLFPSSCSYRRFSDEQGGSHSKHVTRVMRQQYRCSLMSVISLPCSFLGLWSELLLASDPGTLQKLKPPRRAAPRREYVILK